MRSSHTDHGPALVSETAVCLWIPLFPLRCEERRRNSMAGKPIALLSPEDARRVWLVSPIARRVGVRPGMTVSQAIGLCSSLAMLEPDPVYYDEQFTRLLLALENVSPVIEPAELGRVYVGVDGLEKLVGSPERQLEVIAATLRRRDGKREARWSRLGWGRGKFVSWVAASRAKPGSPLLVRDEERARFLATQPVAVLPISPDTHHRLWQLGIKTLGELARLPEAALVSQFGREGRLAWQLARGTVRDFVEGRQRPEPIIAALDFPAPVADRAMLLHSLGKLVERALNHPRRAGWRIRVVRVRAGLEQGASWMVEATLKDPSADRDRIVAPLGTRLENSPPTGAVERLKVEFTDFARGTEELQLFARDANSAARAGRRRALRAAAQEIALRLKRHMLHHVIEVQPWSRIPERRYALIDLEY